MSKKIKATLYISEEKREKIRGSGLSMEAYFNQLYEMHEHFNMDGWKDGYFNIGYFRVCLLRAETLNLILSRFNDGELATAGQEVGEKLRSIITKEFNHYLNLTDESKMSVIGYLNRFSGWGHFTLENDTIIITKPIFIQPHFVQGYIEGLLDVKLTTLEYNPERMAFKLTS